MTKKDRLVLAIAKKYPPVVAIALLLLVPVPAVLAQDSSSSAGASLAETLSILTNVVGSGQVGDFMRVSTSLEVATTPFGTSSGAFVFKLDPTTGLEVRTASTFGPAFAERAITAGAGQVSAAVNVIAATYDKLGDLKLDRMVLASSEAGLPEERQQGIMSLVLSSESTVINGVIGATDKLDIGVVVPIIRVKLNGLTWVQNAVVRQQANGTIGNDILVRATGSGSSSGLGDLGVSAKYRLLRFGGTPPPDAPLEPDPGGIALLSTVRLPTGSREQLRGLGITRALLSVIVSGGKGKLRPHGNVGFDWWEKGVDIQSPGDPTVTMRHQVQYGAGLEFAASPKLTMMIDVLGRHVLGGGRVGFNALTPPDPFIRGSVTSLTYALATNKGIRKLSIVPGLKWNLKGKALLSLSGIATISDNGLHDLFTPVVGFDMTF